MKTWKRNMVVAVILLFVCAAVYLNWSYSQEVEAGTQSAGGKLLGEATLVSDISDDPLLETADQDSTLSVQEQEQTGYFSAARLNRQQARDSALSLLQDAAGDETADQTMRDQANTSIQTMAAYTLSEAQVENLITAKGYEDCICFIGDSSASVVVAAVEGGLTDTDTTRIMEIVKEETGLTAAQIKIIEAEQ
jgi:stage III sporulation protein AH